MTIYEKVRIEAGMNQKQMAKYLGVSESAVSRYESGERRPKAYAILKYIDAVPNGSELFSKALEEGEL